MRAWMLLLAWASVGLLVSLRGGPRPAWERALAVAFWPFFLPVALAGTGGEGVDPGVDSGVDRPASASGQGPVACLRLALAPDDPAQALVERLAAALDTLQARVFRLEQAVTEAEAGSSRAGEPSLGAGAAVLAAARDRSRALLVQALEQERKALGEALAAIEEVATRMWLLREAGQPAEVEALLRALAARLDAGVEVARTAGTAG